MSMLNGKKEKKTIERLRREVRTNRKYEPMRMKIHEWLLGNVREAITSADDNKADANADASNVPVEKAVLLSLLKKPKTKRVKKWGMSELHAMTEALFHKHARR